MDLSSIIGLVMGIVIITGGILIAGPIMYFWDFPSLVIVLGGGVSAYVISTPLNEVLAIGGKFQKVFTDNKMDPEGIITKIIELANIARREGLLSLEEAVSSIKDEFLQKGVMLIVDGTDPELIKNILETDVANMQERHGKGKAGFEVLGGLVPAFGMVGTLIGLVLMLYNMADPSSIGPSMAVALITTFYGSLFANLFFAPFANKLGSKSASEVLVKQIMIEGLLSIQAGENPRVIEEKLKSFLSPAQRRKMTQLQGADQNNG